MPSTTATGDFVEYVDDVTNGRGVDIAFDSVGGQVTTDTFRTMAFNGRHLIVGFAADITLEEQPVSLQPSIYGNFDLVGICFAFVDDPRLTHSLGMNFLTAGRRYPDLGGDPADDRRPDGSVRWSGGRSTSTTSPAMLEAIERRQTMGKTIVRALSPAVR